MKKRVTKKLKELARYARESEANLKRQWGRIPAPDRADAEKALDRQLEMHRARVVSKAEAKARLDAEKRALDRLDPPKERPNPKRSGKSAMMRAAMLGAVVR